MSELKPTSSFPQKPAPDDLEGGTDAGQGTVADTSLTPEEDKRLLRKIDRCLLPLMAITYLFQFLDKSALGFTAILGLREDLSLSGLDFSWASGIYYFGYLVASYPAGVLMVRLPVAKVISGSVLCWGVILTLTATCFNAGGLLANRFFLGVAEAAVAPGLSIVVSMWYKRSEQPLRHGAWFLGNTVAGIFGGLFAYGIGHIQTIPAWKAIFVIFGAITVGWGVAVYWALPDLPSKAWFLGEEDRFKAVLRVKENLTGIKSDKFQWYQCREAFLDPKLWLLVLIQLAYNIANGGIHSFGSIIINGMGFSTLNTLLIQMIAYSFQGIFVLLATTSTTYIPNIRTYVMALNMVISIAGSTMIRQIESEKVWARFFGYCLCMAYTANFPMVLAMSSSNFGGFTKKTTANSMLFIAYCVSNIVGPQLFFAREAPSYKSGFFSMMICFSIATVSCLALRFYLIAENRRRDRLSSIDDTDFVDQLDINSMDKTDGEIKQFRYVY